jgi:hypothetical protein
MGMFINIQADHILRNLRKPGEKGYKIPKGKAVVLVYTIKTNNYHCNCRTVSLREIIYIYIYIYILKEWRTAVPPTENCARKTVPGSENISPACYTT